MEELTIEKLIAAAKAYTAIENSHSEPELYGVDNGKTIGTYLENKFTIYLNEAFEFEEGNAASGIDIPGLGVDIKTTSIAQPQSSCPFRSARQKVYGLGYHLLVFVYSKSDDHEMSTAKLNIQHVIFVEKERTADFQMTSGLLQIIANDGNEEDIFAFLMDKNLPVDEVAANNLAKEILVSPPAQGYLTISNALQWRLQYGRAISKAGLVNGLQKVF